MMALSGLYGPEIWAHSLTSVIPALSPFLSPKTSLRDVWWQLILAMFTAIHLPACIYNVYVARKAKNLPLLPTLLEWFPMFVYTGACCAWLGSPYSTILGENHLVLFCLTMSLVFGRMTTKIILAHLTRQPFPYWTVMLVPLLGGTFLGNLPIIGLPPVPESVELWYLRGYFGFALIAYSRWAVLVISSICDYLGINCLTIPADKRKSLQESRKPRSKTLEMENGNVANGGPAAKQD